MEGRKTYYVNMSLHHRKICKTYMYIVLLQAISVANYFLLFLIQLNTQTSVTNIAFSVLAQITKGLLAEKKSRCDLPTHVRRSDQQCLWNNRRNTWYKDLVSRNMVEDKEHWIMCEDVFVWLEIGFITGNLKKVINLQCPQIREDGKSVY